MSANAAGGARADRTSPVWVAGEASTERGRERLGLEAADGVADGRAEERAAAAAARSERREPAAGTAAVVHKCK